MITSSAQIISGGGLGSGVAGISAAAPTGPTFAAPSVIPAVAGSSTWGYIIVARQATVNIAISSQGTTATGTATLSGIDTNTVTWLAVPGATAYDVFVSTTPLANPGYITTVTGLSYVDTGTPASDGVGILPPSENGFVSTQTGIHAGNLSWSDIEKIPGGYAPSTGFDMASPLTVLIGETVAPTVVGTIVVPPNFTGGNFFAYAHGTTPRTPVGSNSVAIADVFTPNGINGSLATAINNAQDSSINIQWAVGATNAAVNRSPGNTTFVLGTYSTAQNLGTIAAGKQVHFMANYYSEAFVGNHDSKIVIFAPFYAATVTSIGTNAGAAALTASFYTEDTGSGSTDWSFYSAGGRSRFGTINITAAAASTTAGQLQIGNAIATLTGAPGSAVTTNSTASPGPTSTTAVAGYIKMFLGTQAIWFPYLI